MNEITIEEIKKQIIGRGYIGYEETLLSSLEKEEQAHTMSVFDLNMKIAEVGIALEREKIDNHLLHIGLDEANSRIKDLCKELEREKENSEYFRLEVNRLTDELAEEKERTDRWQNDGEIKRSSIHKTSRDYLLMKEKVKELEDSYQKTE